MGSEKVMRTNHPSLEDSHNPRVMKTSLYKAVAGSLLLLAAASTSLHAQTFTGQDVGTPTHHGGFTNNVDGTISVNGGGDDIWNNGDNFYYYYTSASGLIWDARMRVVSFTGPDYWSKIELMVRRPSSIGTAPAGADPEMCVGGTQTSQQNEIRPTWRGTRAGASSDNGGDGIAPGYPNRWLRVTRVNNTFNFYTGSDGTNWTLLRTHDTSTTADGFDGTPWENPILVGAGVTAHNDGDVNGATAVISNLAFVPFNAATAMGVVTQIQSSVTVYQYTEASFRFAATNNASPIDLVPVQYAWYKNNQLVSTNPMGPDYTFLTTPADNGVTVYAVASVNPPAPYSSVSITSAVATVTTIPQSVIYTNGLKQEFFAGALRQDVDDGSMLHGTASKVSAADIGSYGNNYTIRLSGFFIPPTTTAYVFFICGDDDSDLFLSSSSDPSQKQLVAQENNWSNPYSWLSAGSTGPYDATQKRSDMWSPDPTTLGPVNPNGFYLTAGNLYYIEAVEHQGGGGADLAVTYQTTNEMADPSWSLVFTNGVLPRLADTNNNIALITSPFTNFTWAVQPTNLTVFEGANANFFSKVSTDSELAPTYQWYLNNAPYPGATGPELTLPSVTLALNVAQVYVVANSAEGGLSITSSVVTLAVQQAVWEPGFAKDERWDGSNRSLIESGNAGDPGYTMAVPAWEVAIDGAGYGNNFGRRVSGFFVPPTTGRYVFFANSDDDSDLYLSTDNSPAHKRLIAQEIPWSNAFQWLGDTGGAGVAAQVAQKRSDTFVDPVSGTQPYASGIQLSAGQRYYMEQDYSQGGGGANLEATFKLTTDNDPGNGAASRLVGNTIGINAVRCSYVAFTTQPANVTVPPSGYAVFNAVGITDSQLAVGQVTGGEASYTNNFVLYQWYKNGTAIPGANSSTLVIAPVQAADNGALISCQIRALGYADNTLTPIWSNSVTATLTLSPQAVFEPGWAFVEWWPTNSPSRVGVETYSVGVPSYVYATPKFETSVNQEAGDNYANRISGYFIPATSGNYTFFLNSDDDSDLFLSTDSTPANKRLIAQETGWATGLFHWTDTTVNGDIPGNRRSDSFTDPNTGLQPYVNGIPLIGGQMYYIEDVHHEGGGNDYTAVTFKNVTLNDPDPTTGSDSIMAGNLIGMYAPRVPWVAFSQQPQSQTVTSGGNAVTFTANGFSAPALAPGTTGDPRPLFGLPATNVLYQWYKNSTPIAGATTSSYTQVPTLPSDNGSSFVVAIRTLGYADNSLNATWSNSTPAVLTVITDTVPPTISYAAAFQNTNQPALFIVDITFSKWMDAASLSNATYSVAGVNITNISIAANHQTVQLLVDRMPTLPLNVTVSGAKDLSGNTIAPNSSAALNPVNLTSTDVGTLGFDPAYPSFLWADGVGGFIVSAEGSDIYGNADGFNFLWESKTNDFDVVVRQKSTTHTSNWAKGGLMVRETLDAASRNWNIVNDPDSADGIMAPDGSGYGANNVECNARVATAGASASWENLTGAHVPAYPNAWVRLKRTGNILDAYLGTDGKNWIHAASTDPSTNGDMTPLPSVVYLGICTTAHNNDALGVTPPPPFLYYNTAEYANYSSSYVAGARLSGVVAGGNITISWAPAGGHLESSPAVSGAGVSWQPVLPNANPTTLPLGPGPRYFRVVNP